MGQALRPLYAEPAAGKRWNAALAGPPRLDEPASVASDCATWRAPCCLPVAHLRRSKPLRIISVKPITLPRAGDALSLEPRYSASVRSC